MTKRKHQHHTYFIFKYPPNYNRIIQTTVCHRHTNTFCKKGNLLFKRTLTAIRLFYCTSYNIIQRTGTSTINWILFSTTESIQLSNKKHVLATCLGICSRLTTQMSLRIRHCDVFCAFTTFLRN